LSISEFAKSIGLSAKKYEKFERIGERVPEKIIKLVAEKYGVSIKWLKAEI
jgi:transcriptional regulator with XRE-family HTH domain